MYFCGLKIVLYKMRIIKILPFIAAIALLSSCKVPQKVSYFQDLYAGKTLTVSEYQGVRLRPGDHINIIVKSKNETIAKQLNIGDSFGATGYLLDQNGDVEFLQIGKIHLAGMTREEVQNRIKDEIEKRSLGKDVIVSVEYVNLHFSVLGEVKVPHEYEFKRDKVTITEAIAMAGDLTINGTRDRVFVLREEGGKRVTYQLSLLNAEQLVQSPAYYLQQNDIVYVDMNDTRKRQSTASGNQFQSASIWVSMISLISTITILLLR